MNGAAALRGILREALGSVETGRLVREALAGGLPAARGLHLLAVGKAASAMARAAAGALGEAVLGGLVVSKEGHGGAPPPLTLLEAGHPHPDARSLVAADAALALASRLGPEDVLLALISGGASALLCAPVVDLGLADKRATIDALVRGGATISEVNAVRKHLSRIKGGRLAAATMARVHTLLLCDVPGGDPSTIGSGPTLADPTSFADALAVLERRAGREAPEAARRVLTEGVRGGRAETPKPGDPRLSRARARVLADNGHLVAAAARSGARAGFGVEVLGFDREGEVEALAAELAALARTHAGRATGAPRLFVAGGEPTVRIGSGVRPGRGGRAQQLALLVAGELRGLRDVAFLAAGSDGTDGPTDAAGGCVDGATWDAIGAAGGDPAAACAALDAYGALDAAGALVRTGPTGTNLLDLHLLAVGA